jgi:integrase
MDAIRVADRKETERGELITRLTMKTAKRHFSALSQLWEWLRPRDHVEKNIFRGFSFPGTKSKKRLRDDWSEEDLLKLLSSPWYRPEVEREAAQRWLPVIAMFSGLRLEEICRLRPAHDITEVSGVPVFKIQDHPDPEPWSPKSEAGERVVPIHPVLIEMGVLGLAGRRGAEGAKRLFPELRPSGPDLKYGTEFSRRFGKLKEAIGVGEKTVFHSFRHSVRTILGNTDIKDSWIDAVLGHEGGEQSVGIAVYLKRIGVENLKTLVGAISYPDDVMDAVREAMSHLEPSRTAK